METEWAAMESSKDPWTELSHEEKNHELYLKQKALLDQFLSTGAITRAQHDKSLHDLTEKMQIECGMDDSGLQIPRKN